MSKILVTGGAGFIGSHVCELLIKQDHQVVAFDNLSTGSHNIKFLKSIGVSVVKGDITDLDAVSNSAEGVDTIIHLAAMNRAPRSIENPALSNEVNITGTVNILEVARNKDLKVSFSSSSSVFGNLKVQPRPEETDTFRPSHPYGLGKLASERYINLYRDLYGLDAVTIRYFSVYGPRQSPKITYSAVIPKFISRIQKDQPIEIHGGEQTRNFTYVKDNARATVLLSKSDVKREVYNIGGSETISINQLAQTLEEISGKKVEKDYTDFRQGDIMNSIPDMTNLNNEFDFTHSYTLKGGLRETYDWIKSNPSYFE